DQTVLRFAEQFSVDVSALDESLRADLWAALGEGPREARGRFLAMAWVGDPRSVVRCEPAAAGDRRGTRRGRRDTPCPRVRPSRLQPARAGPGSVGDGAAARSPRAQLPALQIDRQQSSP